MEAFVDAGRGDVVGLDQDPVRFAEASDYRREAWVGGIFGVGAADRGLVGALADVGVELDHVASFVDPFDRGFAGAVAGDAAIGVDHRPVHDGSGPGRAAFAGHARRARRAGGSGGARGAALDLPAGQGRQLLQDRR